MKLNKYFLIFILFPLFCQGQVVKGFQQLPGKLNVTLEDGTLSIIPLADNAVRIKFYKLSEGNLPEFVFTPETKTPGFRVDDFSSRLEIKTSKITVSIDKNNGKLTYVDNAGKVFLAENEGSRRLLPDTIQGEPCFVVEQSFESSTDESIFGLGQFQDGQFNLKNITRRLTQVNSQIAIPFMFLLF